METRCQPVQAYSRFIEIDLLRTVAIFLMIVYHLGFDLSFFHGFSLNLQSGLWMALQRTTANLFLLLVGISLAISHGRMEVRAESRSHIVRKFMVQGLEILACGGLVSLVTWMLLGDLYVRFGVLHLIGVVIVLSPLLLPLREGCGVLALVILVLGRITRTLNVQSSLLLPLGMGPIPGMVDYFPIIPWSAPILIGIALGNFLYNRGFLRVHLPNGRWMQRLTFPGRHSLLIYLVHQPVLLGILRLLELLRMLPGGL